MEVQDGFIVGVFNYCDSWCDTCPFTSRCRVFADMAETEASFDPNMKAVADAPLPPEDVDMYEWRPRRFAPEHASIDTRAEHYSRRARTWLKEHERGSEREPGDPRSVISWFHMLIHVKAMRALHGLAEDNPAVRDWPADYDGSAKVALIGIDRSQMAWLDVVDLGLTSPEEAAAFVDDLSWLREALERTFPNARAFVRPGFDEPDQVVKLLTSLD